jgi:uncharacterized protein (DUF983 family)
MKFEFPIWSLKIPCPHCGQGNPIFIRCLSCNYLTVQCDETAEMFENPRDLSSGFTVTCPQCGLSDAQNFAIAKSQEILNAGFKSDEFK